MIFTKFNDPTLADVARKANVSSMTVPRVIRSDIRFKATTRDAVRAAVADRLPAELLFTWLKCRQEGPDQITFCTFGRDNICDILAAVFALESVSELTLSGRCA